MTFWVVIYCDAEFIAWVWTQLSYFEYKSAPKKEHMYVQLPGKWKIRGHSTKKKKKKEKRKRKTTTTFGSWRSLYVYDNVECLGSWIFSNIGWLSTFHCLLVECYIIWSRFVNETHEYLINSFIDHRRSDSLCICTKEILLDRQKVGIMPTGYRTEKWVLYMLVYRLKNKNKAKI